MRSVRAEWLFGGAFVVLLLVAIDVLPVPEAAGKGDSFGEDAGGKRAFFLLTSELLPDVKRSTVSLLPDDENADILMILGPARYPDRAQWQTLHDWVSDGRAIVFAARWGDPAVRLEPFGIEVVPFGAESSQEERETETETETETPESSEGESADEPAEIPFGFDFGLEIDTVLEDADQIEWRTGGHVRTSEEVEVYLTYGGWPQIIWQQVGDGAIVVVASDFLFTNRSLTRERNGMLAFRVLETASPVGPVYFDESLNEAGAPKVVGILLEPPFRLSTIQLLLIVTLYLWAASRRFGPIRTEEKAARRSLVEHAEALGSLHFRAGTATALLSSYLEFFRRELGLTRRGPAGFEAAPDNEPPSVTQALRAAKNPNLDRGKLAHLIQSLARTRQEKKGAT